MVSTYLQTLVVFLLLFVYYAKPEIYFVRFLEVWLHVHDLRKGLLGMFERPIAVVEDTNAVPQLWFLKMLAAVTGVRTSSHVPWDLEDGTMLVDTQRKPAVDLPS